MIRKAPLIGAVVAGSVAASYFIPGRGWLVGLGLALAIALLVGVVTALVTKSQCA